VKVSRLQLRCEKFDDDDDDDDNNNNNNNNNTGKYKNVCNKPDPGPHAHSGPPVPGI
jgi:hypothetical protein